MAKAVADSSACPALTILYGSRARGDYRDGSSDIDLLLVQDNRPTPAQKDSAYNAANKLAKAQYGYAVNIQILWYTAEELARYRRTANHLIARALDEGIVMSSNPDYDLDPSNNDYAYEWTVTEQRVRHAEIHLETFRLIHGSQNPVLVDRMAGKNAQEALEHALKALISANNVRYERTHQLTRLVHQVAAADPDFAFAPSLDYAILDQYDGPNDRCDPIYKITYVENYFDRVAGDVQKLLARVREVRASGSCE